MKTNLFRCGKPGQANQMALRYLFTSASSDKELEAITVSLIESITGFSTVNKKLEIHYVWPAPFDKVGLNVEVTYGDDLYHLCFFFFEYGEERDVEEEILASTACIRGDHDSKGCFLIHYRPEDSTKAKFHRWKDSLDGGTEFVHINGKSLYETIGTKKCSDPIIVEYIEYVSAIHDEMTTQKWSDTWLSSPVAFENYVENYLRPLLVDRYRHQVSVQFSRPDSNVGVVGLSIDTGFDLRDPRGIFVDSWMTIELRIEFPNPVAVIRVLGDCFCLEEPEDWIYEENMNEAFYRMRKALDQEGSLFVPKGGKAEPESLAGEAKAPTISLKSESAWSILFPSTAFSLIDNVLSLLSGVTRE